MKKYNLFLCACAIAIIGLFASCKNETVERENVTLKYYRNTYTVTGTASIVTKLYKAESPSEIITNNTSTESITLNSALAEIQWGKSKAYSSNATLYSIYVYESKGLSTKKTIDKDGVETINWPETHDINNLQLNFSLYKIGDKYYFYEGNDGILIMDGFECPGLDSGKDFDLNFSYTRKVNEVGEIASDSQAEFYESTTTTYNLKFKAM